MVNETWLLLWDITFPNPVPGNSTLRQCSAIIFHNVKLTAMLCKLVGRIASLLCEMELLEQKQHFMRHHNGE